MSDATSPLRDLGFGLRYAAEIGAGRARALPVLWRVFRLFDRPEARPSDGPPMGSVVAIDGISMRIDPRMSPMNVRKLAEGRHTQHERELLAGALHEGDRVLELGGGIGMVAIECARRIGSEAVTSYEANPELESLIRENYSLNGVSPDLRIAMVGEAEGSRSFHVSAKFSQSSIYDVGQADHAVEVPVHDFARVMAELRPTALVVDIQGAERELFRWGRFDGVRLILVEMHPHIVGLAGMLAIRRRLRAEGFTETERSGNSYVYERPA